VTVVGLVCVEPRTSALNTTLPAARAPPVFDRYLLPASKLRQAEDVDRRDRQTDIRWTSDRYTHPARCTACYAGSVIYQVVDVVCSHIAFTDYGASRVHVLNFRSSTVRHKFNVTHVVAPCRPLSFEGKITVSLLSGFVVIRRMCRMSMAA